MNKKLSIVLPCFGRPERTRRSLECVLKQDMADWELFFIGDGCPDFEKLISSDWFAEKINSLDPRNEIIYFNLEKNVGGFGHAIVNYAIEHSSGDYFLFYANDDIIFPHHFSNYYNNIVKEQKDFMYFNSLVILHDTVFTKRNAQLTCGSCGHSELIIKTSLLKQAPKHDPIYGHDFTLIQNLMSMTDNYSKSESEPTYVVMGTPFFREKTID